MKFFLMPLNQDYLCARVKKSYIYWALIVIDLITPAYTRAPLGANLQLRQICQILRCAKEFKIS